MVEFSRYSPNSASDTLYDDILLGATIKRTDRDLQAVLQGESDNGSGGKLQCTYSPIVNLDLC